MPLAPRRAALSLSLPFPPLSLIPFALSALFPLSCSWTTSHSLTRWLSFTIFPWYLLPVFYLADHSFFPHFPMCPVQGLLFAPSFFPTPLTFAVITSLFYPVLMIPARC